MDINKTPVSEQTKNRIFYGGILFFAVLFGLIISLSQCGHSPANDTGTKKISDVTKYDTILLPGDTVTHEVVRYKYVKAPQQQGPDIFDTTSKDLITKAEQSKSIQQHIDSAYYAKRYYHDTMTVDGIFVQVNDTITQNKIKRRKVFVTDKKPQKLIIKTETVTLEKEADPRTKFYIGAMAGTTFGAKPGIAAGPEIALLSKKEVLYTLQGDLLNRGILAGACIKLHFGK